MTFKPRILVVEDEPQMLGLLEELLTRRGAEPVCVDTGREAARLIGGEKFDGFFLDWLLPEIDGLELAQRIRCSKHNSLCPIVMITGLSERNALQQCLRAGVNFFLQKPVSVEQIQRLVTACWDLLLQERLRYQRVPVQGGVTCEWRIQDFKRTAQGELVNLSTTGMLVKLDSLPQPMTLLQVRFHLLGDPHIFALDAFVVRTAPGRQVGLRLVNLTWEQRWRLMEFSKSALSLEAEMVAT